jgi:hypothetical protein
VATEHGSPTWRLAVLKRDRELLVRLATVNRRCGDLVLDLLSTQVDDTAYAASLSNLGEAFRSMGAEMCERAAELDPHVIDAAPANGLPSGHPS